MERLAEERPGLGDLLDLAAVHDGDPVAGLGHHREVVGDEEDGGEAGLLAGGEHELEDLRLDGDVERGGRLVGDQQVGLHRQRHRDHHALAHAARELVRIAGESAPRVGDADALEHADRELVRRVARKLGAVRHDRFA